MQLHYIEHGQAGCLLSNLNIGRICLQRLQEFLSYHRSPPSPLSSSLLPSLSFSSPDELGYPNSNLGFCSAQIIRLWTAYKLMNHAKS